MYKISVITPSFNQGEYIEVTINSVINQNYNNTEYIIIDGGSTDNSVEIIEKYKHSITYFESKPDNGQCHAINKGLKKATGDILCWLNSDDYYTQGSISKVINVFENNPNIKILIGGGNIIDENENFVFSKTGIGITAHDILKTGLVPCQPSIFFKKDVVDEIGFLREDLHLVLDWEYWIRMSLNFKNDQILVVNDILSVAREYPGNKTSLGLANGDKSGVLKNDFEKKIILDELFDKKLFQRKNYYLSYYYRNKSIHNFKAGLNKESRKDMLMSIRLHPINIFSIRNMMIYLGSFVGYHKSKKISKMLLFGK
jgi:glycosyltransferase involved in cell wall biosynthesis